MANDRPVHEVRLGTVKAAIWKNETDNGPRYNTTFSRIYRTDAGWQSSDSFGRDELLLLAKVSDFAHTWICQQGERNDSQGESREQNRGSSNKREKAGSK